MFHVIWVTEVEVLGTDSYLDMTDVDYWHINFDLLPLSAHHFELHHHPVAKVAITRKHRNLGFFSICFPDYHNVGFLLWGFIMVVEVLAKIVKRSKHSIIYRVTQASVDLESVCCNWKLSMAAMLSAICLCIICLVCGGGSSIPFIYPPSSASFPALTHTPQVMFTGLARLHTVFCWGQGDVMAPRGTLEDASYSAPALVLSTADVWGQW